MARGADPPDYDPRYNRAQTVEGAKVRYVSDDLPDYGLDDLERDLTRVLEQGSYPDREVPLFEGQEVIK